MGPVGPMGFPWEWELLGQFHGNVNGNGNGLMGMGGNENPTFPIYRSQVADHQTLLMDPSFCVVICRRLQTAILDFTLHVHETLLALTLHVQAYFEDLSVVCIVEFTGHLLSDRHTTSCTGMGAGVNGSYQWEWVGNGNKTRLNMGFAMGMGMNHWEWEGMGLKKIFPLISTPNVGYHVDEQRRRTSAGEVCQYLACNERSVNTGYRWVRFK